MEAHKQREIYLSTLPIRHQQLLSQYKNGLDRIRDAIDANNSVIQQILSTTDQLFLNDNTVYKDGNGITGRMRAFDIEKVQVILKQISRDWSLDGIQERQQCYQPIIDEIISHFSEQKVDPNNVKILVPGAGLGRLMYELAFKGYFCEGNEFSFFMLIASNFILNRYV